MMSENLAIKNASHCVLSVLVLSLLVLGQHSVTGDTMSACSNSPNKTLDIQCSPDYMVHIVRSFYGYSPSGQCRLVPAEDHMGCVEDDGVHYDCVGRPNCVINLPPGDSGVNIKACDVASNYFQVDYKCVKENTVYDICREKRLTDESGYIRTPGYPNAHLPQGQCKISILAAPSQQIRLHIIDLQLQDKGHTDCFDYIYFHDTQRSITLCGLRKDTSYIMKSSLNIEVFSSRGGTSKGFWLHYEAFPPLANSLERPTMPNTNNKNNEDDDKNSNVNNNNNNINNNINNNNNFDNGKSIHGNENSVMTETMAATAEHETQSKEDNQDNHFVETTPVYKSNGNTVPLIRNKTQSSSNNLPFAAIAGGVIGTLSLILFILLLLLLIKWLRERRYYKAEKILEIRNPAFRSSGDFYEQQNQVPNNNHYYNHC